jgi:hypothetical protein
MPDNSERTTETSPKAEGDDEGKALEINDRTEPDEPDLESRSGDDYQGKAFQINDNSKGSDK